MIVGKLALWIEPMTRRRKYLIGIVPVLLLALPLIWLYPNREKQSPGDEPDLQLVIAELDRADPNWRWDDLVASRPQVPDQENLLLRYRSILPSIRGLGLNPNGTQIVFDWEIPKNELRSSEEINFLATHLENYRAALKLVHTLSDLEKSRIPIPPGRKSLDFLVGWFGDEFREIWRLLVFDGEMALQNKDSTTAIGNIKRILAGANSIRDELTLLIHQTRLMGINIACGKIERLLALTEPKEQLQELIPILDKVNKESSFIPVLRGERAFWHLFFVELEADPERYRPFRKADHATYLQTMTEIIQQFKKPFLEQVQWLQTYRPPERTDKIVLAPECIGGHMKEMEAEFRTKVRMQICRVAIAVELFRVQHNRWPKDLQEIPPTFLPEKPIDPYDGELLRYRVIDDGVLLYSVGHDRFDHGGEIPESANPTTKMLLFQLWNPEHRRKPAVIRPELLSYPSEWEEGTPRKEDD
jgi:hypothetical protein